MYIAKMISRTVEAVERERERESNSLVNKIINIDINKKGNINLPCGYYDTG